MTAVVKIEKFDIKELDYNKLLNIEEGRQKQLQLMKDNPYIEITNNQTYTLAKMRRTGLLKGRTGIQGIEKKMATQIRKFRTFIGDTANGLIDITVEAEKKQQLEIDRWERIRAEKKAAKEKIEEERKAKHTQAIEDFKVLWKDVIDTATFKNIAELDEIAAKIMAVTGDFDEFNKDFVILQLELSTEYVQKKREELQLEEDQRILAVDKFKLAEAKALLEEQGRLAKEKQNKIDKEIQAKLAANFLEKRRLRLLSDKERLIETFELINLSIEKFKNKEAQNILKAFDKEFLSLKNKYLKLAQGL